MQILIAEDDLVSRRVLQRKLEQWQYEVVVACDGSQAWEILQKPDAPRLAILDWMMPGLSGPAVCRQVRAQSQEPYTYILVLTSRSQKADLIEAMEAGADDFIVKPFDSQELNARLRAGRRILELQSELVAAREALREQAMRDSLTGLWNRCSILEILQREVGRSRRERNTLGLVMVDLDHFKQINDTHGHIAGDLALRDTAHRLQTSLRSHDAVGRYGGEEFLVVLPGASDSLAMRLAERLRTEINREPVALGNKIIPLSVSLGVTSSVPREGTSPETWIRAADTALYLAKQRGRDRAEFLPLELS